MFKASGRFRFPAKALQMCFRGPMAEAYDLQRNCAVEALLPRTIDHTLTAAADFLQ